MTLIKFILWAFLLFTLISSVSAIDQPATDTAQVEEPELMFVITNDSTKVYKELVPSAPIVYRLKKGDTLTIKEGDSLVMVGHSDYWGKVLIKDTLEGYIERSKFKILNE